MSGRGAWTTTGMPTNGTQYYQLIQPTNVGATGTLPGADLSHRAVMYGVKALQTRINELGYEPKLVVDGWLGSLTGAAIIWAQNKVGTVPDGQAGPTTMKLLFWPVIQSIAGTHAHIVGGISAHESGFDPGAVGFQDPDDLGLVQINGPANPTMTEAERFDYHTAYAYAANRIGAALATPGYDLDAAIASYGYPGVAAYWVASRTHSFPNDPALNVLALNYVKFVKAWISPTP